MYYLQSRYYDPAICRFINADSYASTGQGIIGCNMYAYCLNNPVIYRDSNGQVTTVCLDQETGSNTLPSRGASIGGAAAMALLVTVVASQVAQRMRMESTIAQKKAKAEMVSLPTESNKQLYSVYFLYEDGGSSSDIVYVGRVKTEYFNQRMTYHEKQGRLLAGAIQGLEYGTCRFLEQAGMIYHHCLISTNPLSNKIRGISPTNKNLYEYIAAAFDLACTDRYPDFSLLPLSYFENFVENEFLNLGS